MSVLASGGTAGEPLQYRWSRDGTVLEGRASSTLCITHAPRTAAGEYCAEVWCQSQPRPVRSRMSKVRIAPSTMVRVTPVLRESAKQSPRPIVKRSTGTPRTPTPLGGMHQESAERAKGSPRKQLEGIVDASLTPSSVRGGPLDARVALLAKQISKHAARLTAARAPLSPTRGAGTDRKASWSPLTHPKTSSTAAKAGVTAESVLSGERLHHPLRMSLEVGESPQSLTDLRPWGD